MTDSSNIAYKKVLDTLTKRQLEVLQGIRYLTNLYKHSVTLYDVANHLNTPASNISGRFGELEQKQLIEKDGISHSRYTIQYNNNENQSFTLYKINEWRLF